MSPSIAHASGHQNDICWIHFTIPLSLFSVLLLLQPGERFQHRQRRWIGTQAARRLGTKFIETNNNNNNGNRESNVLSMWHFRKSYLSVRLFSSSLPTHTTHTRDPMSPRDFRVRTRTRLSTRHPRVPLLLFSLRWTMRVTKFSFPE